MHQINFIKSWITGSDDGPFKHGFVVQWFCSPVENGFDAAGVLLMGGEL